MILALDTQIIYDALIAGAVMLGLGSIFALVLLIASIKLRVTVDPKIQAVHEVLPHLDCGACGYAGCGSYAKAVVENPKLIGKCSPGGSEVDQMVAKVLNLQVSDSGPAKRPIVHCRAHTEEKTYNGQYKNITSCTGANALANGQACKFGCLGFGDCTNACKFDALHIIDGLATIDYEKCTGCGACVHACPRYIIEMVPFTEENMATVACSSKENGKTTRQMCQVGCIGCGICIKQCDLFKLAGNLAKVDYKNYKQSEASENAAAKCPTKVIVKRGKEAQKTPDPVKEPPKQKASQ